MNELLNVLIIELDWLNCMKLLKIVERSFKIVFKIYVSLASMSVLTCCISEGFLLLLVIRTLEGADDATFVPESARLMEGTKSLFNLKIGFPSIIK